MSDDLMKSYVDWLRGDHERCNPFIAALRAIEGYK